MLVVHAKRGRMTEEHGTLVLELEDGVSYEEHRESVTKPRNGSTPTSKVRSLGSASKSHFTAWIFRWPTRICFDGHSNK